MTLAVMSAFVAFNGFPGQDVQDPIGTLLLQQRQTPVDVPAKPVHVGVLAATRNRVGGARHQATTVRTSRGPRADTGPVAHRLPSQVPGSTQSPAPAASQDSGTLPVTTSPVSTPTTPSVPDPSLPQVPGVTLPSLPSPPPPGSSQLPVDTSGITGVLGNP
jgi:hypothetical protein